MRILVFEPLKEPYVKDIEDDIQAMQEVVGGSIEPIYFEQTNDALCWCNDEFLLNGSKPISYFRYSPKSVNLISPFFYISGNCLNEYGEWDSCSLADKQIEKYKQQFDHIIVDLPGIGLVAVRETRPEVIEPLEEFEESPEISM